MVVVIPNEKNRSKDDKLVLVRYTRYVPSPKHDWPMLPTLPFVLPIPMECKSVFDRIASLIPVGVGQSLAPFPRYHVAVDSSATKPNLA